MPGLTEKQKKFADFYIQTGNATQAARMAGYSEKTARKTGSAHLRNRAVRQHIDARLEEAACERIADAGEILEYLTRVMRGQDTLEKETEECTAKKKPDSKERLRAAELLGKRYCLFTERKEQEKTEPVMIVDDYL